MICSRCQAAPPSIYPQAMLDAGWAFTLQLGTMCPTCYKGLCEVRARLRREQDEALTTFMREGRPR